MPTIIIIQLKSYTYKNMEKLIQLSRFKLLHEILGQYIKYLNGQNSNFLDLEEQINPYIKLAKKNLIEFQKNIIWALNYSQIQSGIKKQLSSSIKSSRISYKQQYKQQQSQISHLHHQKEQSKIQDQSAWVLQSDDSQQQEINSKQENNSLPEYIQQQIGKYVMNVLTQQKIASFNEIIKKYENSTYFNIKDNRDKVFEFYDNLFNKIDNLFSNQRQIFFQGGGLNKKLVSLGQKVLDHFDEIKVKNFKESILNEAKSYIKNPKQKKHMFRSLQFLFNLVKSYEK